MKNIIAIAIIALASITAHAGAEEAAPKRPGFFRSLMSVSESADKAETAAAKAESFAMAARQYAEASVKLAEASATSAEMADVAVALSAISADKAEAAFAATLSILVAAAFGMYFYKGGLASLKVATRRIRRKEQATQEAAPQGAPTQEKATPQQPQAADQSNEKEKAA